MEQLKLDMFQLGLVALAFAAGFAGLVEHSLMRHGTLPETQNERGLSPRSLGEYLGERIAKELKASCIDTAYPSGA